jgi:hypothetical protein
MDIGRIIAVYTSEPVQSPVPAECEPGGRHTAGEVVPGARAIVPEPGSAAGEPAPMPRRV